MTTLPPPTSTVSETPEATPLDEAEARRLLRVTQVLSVLIRVGLIAAMLPSLILTGSLIGLQLDKSVLWTFIIIGSMAQPFIQPAVIATAVAWIGWQFLLSRSPVIDPDKTLNPPFATAGWVVPGAHLVVPFMTMSKLDGAIASHGLSRRIPKLLTTWWVVVVFPQILYVMAAYISPGSLTLFLGPGIYGGLALAAILAFAVVTSIQRRAQAVISRTLRLATEARKRELAGTSDAESESAGMSGSASTDPASTQNPRELYVPTARILHDDADESLLGTSKKLSILAFLGLLTFALLKLATLTLTLLVPYAGRTYTPHVMGLNQTLSAAVLPSLVVCAVLWIIWQCVLSNRYLMGPEEKTPTWRILLGWAIPGVNVILPYIDMAKLFRAVSKNPRATGPSVLLTACWAAWVGTVVADFVPSTGIGRLYLLSSYGLPIVAAILTMCVLIRIQTNSSRTLRAAMVSYQEYR